MILAKPDYRLLGRLLQTLQVKQEGAVAGQQDHFNVLAQFVDVTPLDQRGVLRKLLVDERQGGGVSFGTDADRIGLSLSASTERVGFTGGLVTGRVSLTLRFNTQTLGFLRSAQAFLLGNLLEFDRGCIFLAEPDSLAASTISRNNSMGTGTL